MKRENLVVLKGQSNFIIRETLTTFEANKHYRCIEMKEGNVVEYLVYGVKFAPELFNEMFEFVYDRILREFNELGLVKDGKYAISKSAFRERMDLHQYGRGKGKLFIGFFGNKMKGLFGFYPVFSGDTKAKFITNAYDHYLQLLDGKMDVIDNEYIQRGNSGIPLSFGDIYFRKPYNPDNKDLAIYY